MYPEPAMLIGGAWLAWRTEGKSQDVFNPATGAVIGQVPLAERSDLDLALEGAQRSFAEWRRVPPSERAQILRRAAALMRERAARIAELMTMEQGKPIAEARGEVFFSAEHVDWAAEEGKRLYGRIVAARTPATRQFVVREPIGPVAGFAPWNFPVLQAAKKVAGALAAGCTIIIKCPEETPATSMETIRCFQDAGIPAGALNLVFGIPAEISGHLISSPIIRKVSFTGSVPVGKQLAALAGQHMKRCTMELGGHAPLIVFDDVDPAETAQASAALKFRNAGQTCISPSRIFVQEANYASFVAAFTKAATGLKIGNGSEPGVEMGPLAAARRVETSEALVEDAVRRGATLRTGGKRIGNSGFYFEATVLTDVPEDSRLMQEEPFGPIAPIFPFRNLDEVVTRANALPYGLAGYVFTASHARAAAIGEALEVGLLSINGAPIAFPETPFGGVKESGYGSEGGIEGLEAFTITKLISEARLRA